MPALVDLHTHSTASDGDLPPEEVVALAAAARLEVVALTDHDTVAGLPAAAEAARRLGIGFVPGIEMSARHAGGTMHILGLGIDAKSPALLAVAAGLREARDQRNPRMIARLRELGVDITMDEVAAFARARGGGEVLGRLHVARVLCEKGIVGDVGEAFARYIGEGKPAYVDKERLEPAEAIAAIRAAGGAAVLAHPVHLNCTNTAQLECVLRSLQHDGLDGVECYHSDHDDRQTRAYLDLARQRGLLVSGGSDFHGPAKANVLIGRPRVPRAAVEQLLAKVGL